MSGSGVHHLCLSHSPLTTMVFRAAMAKRSIPAEQVGSLTRRSVGAFGRGVRIDRLSDDLQAAWKGFERGRFRRLRQELLGHIDRLTAGGPFEAYIPHTRQIIYQEVIGHPRCTGYHFIEEGFTSMAWQSHWGTPPSLRKILLQRLRSRWVGTCHQMDRRMFDTEAANFRGAFAISAQAFRGMPGRVEVAAQLHPLPAGSGPGKTYGVLDTCYLHRGVRWQDYESALVAAIAAQAPAAIAIKFHFADDQRESRFQAIQTRLGALGIAPAELLDASFSIEDHLTLRDTVLFAVSSLGYYAPLLGGRAHSFANQVQGLDTREWIEKGLLPADFQQRLSASPRP